MNTHLSPASRYFGVEQKRLERPDGTSLAHLGRRFVPNPELFALLQEHVVEQGERPDHVAFRYLQDAEQFWRLCDANGCLHPDELTETPGRRIRITLPEGIPGPSGV
jgi:hypothetical protein